MNECINGNIRKFRARNVHLSTSYETSQIPLIPPQKNTQALLSDNKDIPGVASLRIPKSQVVLVFNTAPEVIANTHVLRSRLAGNDNQILECKPETIDALRQNLPVTLASLISENRFPNIVVLPHPSDKRSDSIQIRQIIIDCLKAARQDGHQITLVSPDSSSIVACDTYFPFGKELMGIKLKGMAAHASQMSRTPFDKVTYMANWAGYLENLSRKTDKPVKSFCERFVRTTIRNGQLVASDGRPEALNPASLAFRYNNAILVSPHPDDDLAADAFLVALRRKGISVDNLLLSTGYAAYIPGASTIADKALIRAKEAETSARILGINLVTIVPPNDESQLTHAYEKITEYSNFLVPRVESYFRKFIQEAKVTGKKVLILQPHSEDMHPSHLETIALTTPILMALSKEYNVEIDILQYASPWAGKFNCWSYYDIDEAYKNTEKKWLEKAGLLSSRAKGYVGGELLAGFGLSPYLGSRAANIQGLGKYAERYYLSELD